MKKQIPLLGIITTVFVMSALLMACGPGDGSSQGDLVAFDQLVANAQQYTGRYLCTEGIHVDGFEASGLAATMFEKDGHPELTEPVIWVEGADFQSREDCIRTDTSPSFEFCQAVVCGIFEMGAGFGHGGAYAYQLRGQDVSALPSPAATPVAAASASPTGEAASPPNPAEESTEVEPPPAILEISGREQVSGIGTYCWQEATGTDTAVGICADMVGIPTAEEPLLASSPFIATFRLAPEETPDELLLEVIPVTDADEYDDWKAEGRGWDYEEGERYSMALTHEPAIELSLEPGLYVMNLFGRWQVWGDASYGFLVEVTARTQILFSYHRGGATEVWAIDPISGAVEQRIRPEQTILDPALSPSGESIVYVYNTGDYEGVVSELWLMDRDGGNPHSLYVPPAGQSVLSRPAWQPDGEGIYFLQLGNEAASHLVHVPAQGGEPTLVLTNCIAFALSPDGEWLVSVNLDRQITMWRRDGSRLGDLEPHDGDLTDFDSLAFSPAGGQVAFRATDGDTWNLYVVELSSFDVQRFTDLAGFQGLDPSGGQVNGLAWTADGAQLVYSVDGYPEQAGIWRQEVATGDRERLFVWAEGEWVAVQGPGCPIHPDPSQDAPRGTITIKDVHLTSGEQILVQGQSTLPDGTCLGSELWAGGELQAWWPGETCVPVENGTWQMVVQLGSGEVPSALDPSAQHLLRVFQQNGPDIVAVFAFDPSESFSALPILAVDEQPIVGTEVDGPGHVEYTDRLGDDILARIEGLRAAAAEQRLADANSALAPFGYRLELRFDAEWDRTFYDLLREGEEEPLLAGLSGFWPVSVNTSGTDFVLVAEYAPNVFPLYLQVQAGGVEPWEADQSNWLPPGYVDDALARVTFTGFPTITYQVELDGQGIYSGTAVAMGAYMPLRSFTTWDDHWALEVDDHLFMDGQDLGETLGYDAAFGFHLIQGQPFYFFQQEGKVHISYGGRTLPNAYDQVFHNQCCEAAMHNPLNLGDAVLFHARWNGAWYFVEAGVYDGEMSGTYRYSAPEGWSFRYPMHWDRLDAELGLVQDTATGKTVTFASELTTQAKLESWLESEIARKLAATEAANTLAEPLTTVQESALTAYHYAILSKMEGSETLLRTTVFFDGQRRYEFYAAIPSLSEDEYQAVVASFMPVPAGSKEGR